MSLLGKIAVVTGAGRGIGRAIALTLARHGANIMIADLHLDSAQEFGEALAADVESEFACHGQKLATYEGDLCHRNCAQEMVAKTLEVFGQVDILVNNCGGALSPVGRSSASIVPDEDLDYMLRLNLLSTIYSCQAAVPAIKEKGGGSIINISSSVALDPGRRGSRLSAYGTAKAGVIHYTRCLAHELGPESVRVNAIAPGVIATARILKSAEDRGIAVNADMLQIPLRRFGTPEDVANAVAFLASEDSSFITGQCLSVCGGSILTPS